MKTKRILAILLSAILLLSLTACSFTKTPHDVLSKVKEDIETADAIEISTNLEMEAEKNAEKTNFNFNLIMNNGETKTGKATLAVTQSEKSYDITDVIVKDSNVYINAKSLLDFSSSPIATEMLEKNKEEVSQTIDITAYMDLFKDIKIPEYISIPVNSENTDSGFGISTNTDGLNFILEVAKTFYADAIENEEVISYNSKTKSVELLVDNTACDYLGASIGKYALENTDNLYTVLSYIETILTEKDLKTIYTKLCAALDLSEDEIGSYDYYTLIRLYEDEIKALKGNDYLQFGNEIRVAVSNSCKETLDGTALISINTKDKYVVTITYTKNNKEPVSYEFKVATHKKTTEITTPKNAESIVKILESAFGSANLS